MRLGPKYNVLSFTNGGIISEQKGLTSLSGAYCHKTSTGPPSCVKPRQPTKYQLSYFQTWGMNSYLYAPKDDCKHRAYWREPYTVEEADHLQSLITLATECNIDFCYAISPGNFCNYSGDQMFISTSERMLKFWQSYEASNLSKMG